MVLLGELLELVDEFELVEIPLELGHAHIERVARVEDREGRRDGHGRGEENGDARALVEHRSSFDCGDCVACGSRKGESDALAHDGVQAVVAPAQCRRALALAQATHLLSHS